MISHDLPTKVCAVPGQQLWIDRQQVQLAKASRDTLQRSPNETLDTSETGQEGVTVAAELVELPTATPAMLTSPAMRLGTSTVATTQTGGTTEETTEGTTVPRMSLPLVPSLRLGQTRKASRS